MTLREQQRMQEAWNLLTREDRFGSDPTQWSAKTGAKKYLTALRKTPARIHTCGLGQALAFLRSRGDGQQVEQDIASLTLTVIGEIGEHDLIKIIREREADFLFLATDESIAVIGWLTRYLEGAGVKTAEEEDNLDELETPLSQEVTAETVPEEEAP